MEMHKGTSMKKIVALSALLMGLPLAANAGFYAGIGIGNATVESEAVPTLSEEGFGNLDDNDLSFNVNVGYDLTEHLAVDLAYQDWGKQSDGVGDQRVKATIDMINLTIVGKVPVADSFDLFGRAGVAFANTKFTLGEPTLASQDSDSEDLIYGFGADWNIGSGFSLRLEMDWVELSGFNKARNLSLSALYNFDI